MQSVTPFRELDALIQRLWAEEPRCRFGERHRLLLALRELTMDIERLDVLSSFRPDETIDEAALSACRDRYVALAAHWPDSSGPVAA